MPSPTIFISARFRSGSTLLWNLFRHIPGCVAYYEPCNELLPMHVSTGTRVTSSHRNVDSYWAEYEPILANVKALHSHDFGLAYLLLESEDKAPQLLKYIKMLVASTGKATPVLQFNRMDFRLPWLRRHFPNATIVHLRRNARDNWYSMVRDTPADEWRAPFLNTNYDLVLWSLGLYAKLPLLFCPEVKTSYHRHYILWRLSELMGSRHSDISIDYDRDLLDNTASTAQAIAELAGRPDADIDALTAIVALPKREQWKTVAPANWFTAAESNCENMLEELGLVEYFGVKPLNEIRSEFQPAWDRALVESREHMSLALSDIYGLQRKRTLELSVTLKDYVTNSENALANLRKRLEERKNFLQRTGKRVVALKRKQFAAFNTSIDALQRVTKIQADILDLQESFFAVSTRHLVDNQNLAEAIVVLQDDTREQLCIHLHSVQKQVAALATMLLGGVRTVYGTDAPLDSKLKPISVAQEEITQLTLNLRALKSDKEKLFKDAEQTAARHHNEMHAIVRDKNHKITQGEALIQTLREQIQTLEQGKAQAHSEHMVERSSLQNRIDKLELDKTALVGALEGLEAELRSVHASGEAEDAKLRGRLGALECEKAESIQTIARLEEELLDERKDAQLTQSVLQRTRQLLADYETRLAKP